MNKESNLLWFKEFGAKQVKLVGGKNASLGEMYQHLSKVGVNVPNGFALTTNAYRYFLRYNNLETKIQNILSDLDVNDDKNLHQRGEKIRKLIQKSSLPKDLQKDILKHYRELSKQYKMKEADVAVRTSATAEDLPGASFAGQYWTYLNVRGEKKLFWAIRNCFASLFTDRAIFYRATKGFSQLAIALSLGVQKMVRSDLAASGIMFTLDTESGFPNVVLIESTYGLGEMIVQGEVNPDEFYVFKPTLAQGYKSIILKNLGSKERKFIYSKTGIKKVNIKAKDRLKFSISDDDILTLAKWGVLIEKHYSQLYKKWTPMDMEWAKDGQTGKLYIVQARPETVHGGKKITSYSEYKIQTHKKPLLTGVAVGNKIAEGKAHIIRNVSHLSEFQPGEILVTRMTDPDWVPIMKKAKAIITDEGGRACFAPDTKILTNRGVLTIKEIAEHYKEEEIKVPSLNRKTLEMEWKNVIGGTKRKSKLITIDISQTGRMKNNILHLTPDHKFLTFQDRKLISEEIQRIIEDKKYILSTYQIPPLTKGNIISPEESYLLGGIFTDGYISLNSRHGEVGFVQKKTPEKSAFIKEMQKYFEKVFKYSPHEEKERASEGIIRNKLVRGSATTFRCYSKEIASHFRKRQEELSRIILSLPQENLYRFLAGVIDGDGTYNEKSNRINIFCSKRYLLEAITLTCLRLGINFQVSKNRNIWNIQIVDKIPQIFNYTLRVKGNYERIRVGTRFFSAKQLLEDIVEKINYKGRMKTYVNYNRLIDTEKIRDYIIPMIKGAPENHSLTRIINSPLKMLRVKLDKKEDAKEVYNIEVEGNHNYVVFTNRMTPLVVENCHAAIISRELGIPCVVGTEKATKIIKTGDDITVDCTKGLQGNIYSGKIKYQEKTYNLEKIPKLKTKIMVNIGAPEAAFQTSFLPNDGVGLAREEFIIGEKIGIHPLALYHYNNLKNKQLKNKIAKLTIEHKDKREFFIKELAEGIAQIAAAFYPKPVIVRFSDFKTNEYAKLVGGELFEPKEDNPMLGWRGASRYYDKRFQPAFEMECDAMKRVRDTFGLKNVKLMIPFCRTVEEGKKVLKIMEKKGLKRGKDGLEVYIMCEIPANVELINDFLDIFDGMSIGSNDLTQLTLGIDRDNASLQKIGDERNAAVKKMVSKVIATCRRRKKYVGICGDAPSSLPDFANFLVKNKIPSMSLSPDAVIKTILYLSKISKKRK